MRIATFTGVNPANHVGNVPVGGDAPISVQTMTNTVTGMPAPPSSRSAASKKRAPISCAFPAPMKNATSRDEGDLKASEFPVVADIHFHYKRAIEAAETGAACLRINPGNIGSAQRVREVVQAAKDHGCSMRIGVNAGSLENDLLERYGEPCPEAMVESALNHARILDDIDFHEYKISVKASDPFLAVAAYQALAEAIDCPLHLGITEAGGMISGTVKSSIGMGMLLWSGIGDTIRVSLSADPVEEVRVGFDILKSLNLRHRGVNIISCPSCARQGFNVIDTVRLWKNASSTSPRRCRFRSSAASSTDRARQTRPISASPAAARARAMARSISTASRPTSWTTKNIVDHVVELCEKKAAEIEAAPTASPRSRAVKSEWRKLGADLRVLLLFAVRYSLFAYYDSRRQTRTPARPFCTPLRRSCLRELAGSTFVKLSREHAELAPVIAAVEAYRTVEKQLSKRTR